MALQPRQVTTQHIRWREPITIRFGFTGITADEAATLAQNRLREQFPDLVRPSQCVYVVRLKGEVAVDYGVDKKSGAAKHSPVVYIGEGNAASRLKSHTEWFSELLVAIPNAAIEVRIADCIRPGDTTLCQYVEADLIQMFVDGHSCLPWFNKQRETSHQGWHSYSPEVLTAFNQRIGVGKGSKFLWAIRPLPNNAQHGAYATGRY